MAAHARLKNEFTKDEKYHSLMTWLVSFFSPATDVYDSSRIFSGFPVGATNTQNFGHSLLTTPQTQSNIPTAGATFINQPSINGSAHFHTPFGTEVGIDWSGICHVNCVCKVCVFMSQKSAVHCNRFVYSGGGGAMVQNQIYRHFGPTTTSSPSHFGP